MMPDDCDDIRLSGYDWAGGDAWNVPWDRIELFQAQMEEVARRVRDLEAWQHERAVLRAAGKGHGCSPFAELSGDDG
ncbi:hypothetical protein ACI3L1_17850 [Deinococcus sp. SM5_A1]|uniref:hypothetical protein n=1 Tax=Deinococcus sp. SM5_A1 TaxID=3379094 RepID=UPI00385EF555